MSAEERNKAILARFFDEVVNRGRYDVVDELFPAETADAAKRIAAMWREAFPDLVLTVDDMIAEGDRVAASVTISGTHAGVIRLGALGEIAPTGRRATWTGVDLVRIVDGKITERRSPRDVLGMLRQLGALPGAR